MSNIDNSVKGNSNLSPSGETKGGLISGAEALMRSLEHEGVETLFGYPGGAIMPTFDALYDHKETLNHILVRHEQAAVHAAQGYARVSGRVGCCIVTSGPGAMNTITGVADAMIDSTPIVVICGQVGAAMLGTDAFQEVDVVGVTQPITKWNYQIRRAEDIPWAVARAFYIAKSGRPGPVVLDFTKNAQTSKFEYEPQTVDIYRQRVRSWVVSGYCYRDNCLIRGGCRIYAAAHLHRPAAPAPDHRCLQQDLPERKSFIRKCPGYPSDASASARRGNSACRRTADNCRPSGKCRQDKGIRPQ